MAWFRIKYCAAPAIKEIDQHITAVNKLSGMSEQENENYLSTSKPLWTFVETGVVKVLM
ncbi:hypothetical protein GCM10023229_09590 [Flavisolibacter ginsenosidimutans]